MMKKRGRKKGWRKPIPEKKTCPWCHIEKPIEEFYLSLSRGYNHYCIPCDKEVAVLYSINRRMLKHGIGKLEQELLDLVRAIERRQMVMSGQFANLIHVKKKEKT